MDTSIIVRPFSMGDAEHVKKLFIRVSRQLAPPHMVERFEGYIVRSLREEIDQISDYYGRKQGGFRVAVDGARVVGMFGLEPSSAMATKAVRVDVAGPLFDNLGMRGAQADQASSHQAFLPTAPGSSRCFLDGQCLHHVVANLDHPQAR